MAREATTADATSGTMSTVNIGVIPFQVREREDGMITREVRVKERKILGVLENGETRQTFIPPARNCK